MGQGMGATVVYVVVDGSVAAALAITDPVRDEAAVTIQELMSLNITVAMLTGDAPENAHAVADHLMKGANQGKTEGKDETFEVNASMLPDGKLHWVRTSQKSG